MCLLFNEMYVTLSDQGPINAVFLDEDGNFGFGGAQGILNIGKIVNKGLFITKQTSFLGK